MSKKQNQQHLEHIMISNIPHILDFAQGKQPDDDECANFVLTVSDNRAVFRLDGDKELTANSFEVEVAWNEKCAYKLKVKPVKDLRRKAKEIVKHASDRTWGEHDGTYGVPMDHKMYAKARKNIVQHMLRSVVNERVQQIFEDSSRGI